MNKMVREEITFNGKTVADERLRRLMMTIMTAVFMTVGIVFTGIGGGVLYKSNQDTRKCTETVYGTLERYKYSSSSDHHGLTSPVVSYTYNGKTYEWESDTYSSKRPYMPGEKIEVHLDPDDPAHSYLTGYRQDSVLGLIFTIVGGSLLSVAFILLIVFHFINGHKQPAEILVEHKEYY